MASSVDVPEPTSIALLSLGQLGVAASRRKAAKNGLASLFRKTGVVTAAKFSVARTPRSALCTHRLGQANRLCSAIALPRFYRRHRCHQRQPIRIKSF
ncbi:MAG: PEP-CTERM sorting domain-containing protein [Burkholderiaceae bacterium]